MSDALGRIEATAEELALFGVDEGARYGIGPQREEKLAAVVPLLVAVARAAEELKDGLPRYDPFSAIRLGHALAAVERYATENLP